MTESEQIEYELSMTKLDDYKFIIDFNKDSIPDLMMDEPVEIPGGEGKGPSASMLLAAAVGNCLSASLSFCMTKRKIEVKELKTKVKVLRERNENGFWRISGLDVDIMPEVENIENTKTQKCIDIFRNYCVVSSSIEDGIKLNVNIKK